MYIPDIPTIAFTEAWCFHCHATSSRSVIPASAVKQAWNYKGLFIQSSARLCPHHLDGNLLKKDVLDSLQATRHGIYMTPEEVSRWMLTSTRDDGTRPRIDFGDNSLSEKEMDYLIPGGSFEWTRFSLAVIQC